MALRFRGGVLVAKERASRPDLGFDVPRIWRVTPSVVFVANGNLGDMFHLADLLQSRKPKSFVAAASIIRAELHEHVVRLDLRPLALLILLAGVQGENTNLCGFDVIGSQFGCNAWAHGAGDRDARRVLRKRWKADLTLRQAQDLVRRVYGGRTFEEAILRTRG